MGHVIGDVSARHSPAVGLVSFPRLPRGGLWSESEGIAKQGGHCCYYSVALDALGKRGNFCGKTTLKMSSPSPGKRRMDTDVVKLYPFSYLSRFGDVIGVKWCGFEVILGGERIEVVAVVLWVSTNLQLLLCICDPKYICKEYL